MILARDPNSANAARVVVLAGLPSSRRDNVQSLIQSTEAMFSLRIANPTPDELGALQPGELLLLLDDRPNAQEPWALPLRELPVGVGVVALTTELDAPRESLWLRAGVDECCCDGSLTARELERTMERAFARADAKHSFHLQRRLPSSVHTAVDRETHLELALEASSTGLWVWDMITDAVTWSSECYRIHGVERFAGSAPAFFDLVHPDDRERVSKTVRHAATEHRKYWCEFRVVKPSGEIAWVENRGRAVLDSSGVPVRMIGTITDVTDRKKAREAAHEAEMLVQSIIDGANALVFAKDLAGRYFLFNREWLRLVGLTAERARGLTDEQLFGEYATALRENDLRTIAQRSPLVMKESAVIEGRAVVYLSSKFPLLNSKGEIYAVCGFSIDVTEHERMGHELATRERELQSLADNSPDVFTRFDRELRHVFVNSAVEKATGQPRNAFLGKTNRELGMPAALCEKWEAALNQVFTQAAPVSLEFWFGNGSEPRLFEARLVPELNDEGRVAHVLGVTRDVTERHYLEKALRDADRRKDEFIMTLAHELRNPFATLASGLEILTRSPSAEHASRACAAMDRQLRQCIRLIEDLLEASGISLGKVTLRSEQVDLKEVIQLALESTRSALDDAGHQLSVSLPPEPVVIRGDFARLVQVVTNLVTNAGKYTPPRGQINVSMVRDDTHVQIAVEDSGVGIPRELIEQVFVLFSQVAQAGRGAQRGLGVGLAVVKSLVELHGGSVVVRSDGVGRGSTFTVQLPLQFDA